MVRSATSTHGGRLRHARSRSRVRTDEHRNGGMDFTLNNECAGILCVRDC